MKKCLVIGAGIHGVLTAFYLQRKGFDVEVLEEAPQVGTRATFANGCQLSFSHTTPMSIAPSFFSHSFPRPLFIQKQDKAWLSKHKSSQINFNDKFAELCKHANFSEEAFRELFFSLPNLPEGVGHSSGTAFLFENKTQFEWRKEKFELQKQMQGLSFSSYSANEAVEIDDALLSVQNIHGAIFTSFDKTIDALALTQFLSGEFIKNGGKILYNTRILEIEQVNGVVAAVMTDDKKFFGYDFYVYAGGASGLYLLGDISSFDSSILHAVTGYSLTFDVSYSNYCPHVNVIDFTNKVVYSRHGNKLRVAGFFDIASPKNKNKRIQDLYNIAVQTFPILKRQDVIHKWSEDRVFSYDEIPCVKMISKNFAVNTGHGHLGITLSAGSAKKISNMLNEF